MKLTTASGKPVHPIGIGTWGISSRRNPDPASNKYGGVEPDTGHEDLEISAIQHSLKVGQNHIDCAEMYGGFYTDEVVGRALQGAQREDLFIADKLWKTSVGPGLVRPTVEQMLRKLQTNYVDLLYIHAPWDGIDWPAAFSQIDQLVEEGLVRQVGVSNFNIQQMQQAATLSRHPIAANQMNYNVLYRDEVSEEFKQFCHAHDIALVAYQPIKRQAVLHNDVIAEIAKAHDATPAQIALAWLMAQGALPIPKAITEAHIDENLRSVDVRLTEDDLGALSNLAG
jgi:2,5-diketo-D-gluconate reductase B